MPRSRTFAAGLFCLTFAVFGSALLQANDWPQFRGPNRTGLSAETGLLKVWPENGPTVLWERDKLGEAYATISVGAGQIYTQGNVDGKETIFALSEESGSPIWSYVPSPDVAGYTESHGNGPRGTPTIDGNRLYTVGAKGDLTCLETATGKVIWQKNLIKDFGGQRGGWGYCESPLIDGQRLIVTPGGTEGYVIALDKDTGNVIWRCSDIPTGGRRGASAAYSSAILAEVEGVRQVIQFVSSGVVGVNAENGKFLWNYNSPANGTANVSTPIYLDGQVFAASAYGTGGGLAKLTRDGEVFKADEVYFAKSMQNHHGGMVLVDGYLYGFGSGGLICLNFKTGEIAWQNRSVGKGSLTYADGHLYCLGEGHQLGLVEANPKEYVEKSRMRLTGTKWSSWAHPVVSNGRLYIRDQEKLTCYDIRAK